MRNEEKILRTGIAVKRSFRCLRARRFWLPLGVLVAASVAIPVTLVLAAVIVDGMFVYNPAAYSVGGGEGSTPHTWIYFGADRFANNGDSNIGFWFFQNAISLGGPPTATHATPFTGVPCPSGATNCLPGELHRNGDLLIVS